MNESNPSSELAHGIANRRLSRRARLVGGASAATAGIAGLAAGIGVGAREVPPAPGTTSSRQRFVDQVVMITGATSGIVRAAAVAFAREGGRVALCGRRETLGREFAPLAERLATAAPTCALRVTSSPTRSQRRPNVRRTQRASVLWCSRTGRRSRLQLTPHTRQRIVARNYRPGTGAACCRMENVPDRLWHAAAAEWAQSSVPGLGRMANPGEIAAYALMMASDEHAFLTGKALVIDGGKTDLGRWWATSVMKMLIGVPSPRCSRMEL